jgi:hypothetical protein
MARPRSRRLIGAAAVAVAALAIAAGIWVAAGDSGGTVDRPAYLAHVSSVCRTYARKLSRIGAPADVTAYGDVVDVVGRVLPLLRRQAAAMQAVEAPPGLQPRLDRLFAANASAVEALRRALAAARRRDAGGVAKGFAAFSERRDRAHALSAAIGIDCSSN